MQGQFDIYLQDARGYTDEDFVRAQQEGRLSALLKELPVDQEVHVKNTVTHMMAISQFRRNFAGFPGGATPMDRYNNSPLHHILLSYDPSEPAYTDWYSVYSTIHNGPYSVEGSTAGKRFIGYDVETPFQGVNPSGREEVFTRHRFLYLPSQAISNRIRSVSVWWSEYIQDGNEDRGLVARVRMKDAGGQPITLDKSSSQSLLIQYTFSLVSL